MLLTYKMVEGLNENEVRVFAEEIDLLIERLHDLEEDRWSIEYWYTDEEIAKYDYEMEAIKQDLKDVEELNDIDLNLWF